MPITLIPALTRPIPVGSVFVELFLDPSLGLLDGDDHMTVDHFAWDGEVQSTGSVVGTLERVFASFQHTDVRRPPPGYRERSLSDGDVITLDRRESWRVRPVGLEQARLITRTTFAAAIERDRG